MKFIIFFLLSLGSVALASDYRNNRLQADQSVEAGPRRSNSDPVPFTEPDQRERDPLEEREPYRSPYDSPDYQREEARLAVHNFQQDSRSWDPRFSGAICNSILNVHSRWR